MMPAKPIYHRRVTLAVSVPVNFAYRLDRIARETGRGRSELVRDAIERVIFAEPYDGLAGIDGRHDRRHDHDDAMSAW